MEDQGSRLGLTIIVLILEHVAFNPRSSGCYGLELKSWSSELLSAKDWRCNVEQNHNVSAQGAQLRHAKDYHSIMTCFQMHFVQFRSNRIKISPSSSIVSVELSITLWFSARVLFTIKIASQLTSSYSKRHPVSRLSRFLFHLIHIFIPCDL